MGGRNYQDLIVWQKAMDLVEAVYQMTRFFPREEIYALTSQIRRAVVSIPSNIAEGQGRTSKKEFCNFLSIAHGSVREVETQVMIAQRLQYISKEQALKILEPAAEVGRLLQGLMKSVESKK
jgi:four helix bundle protein